MCSCLGERCSKDIQQPQIPPNAPSQVYAVPNDYDQIGSPPSAEPVHDAMAALEDIAVAHLSANTNVDGPTLANI